MTDKMHVEFRARSGLPDSEGIWLADMRVAGTRHDHEHSEKLTPMFVAWHDDVFLAYPFGTNITYSLRRLDWYGKLHEFRPASCP